MSLFSKINSSVVANIDYRLKQVDISCQTEDHGLIDYNLPISSGTGISQSNTLWYDNRLFTSNDSMTMSSLQVRSLGTQYTTSFLGSSGSGNIKCVKVDNPSAENIYINLPFPGFSGSIRVLGSGTMMLSNKQGWPIFSTGVISVSGETSTSKRYTIDLLGSALPIVVRADGQLNYEYYGTGVYSGALNYDFIGSSINTGVLPYEYNVQNSSIDGMLQLEYILENVYGTGTGFTGTIQLEWTSPTGFDNYLNVEWTGYAGSSMATGTGCSGCGTELLANAGFDYGYVEPSSFISNNTPLCTPIVGIPGWSVSGSYHTGYNGPDGNFITTNPKTFRLEAGVNANYCVWPPTRNGTPAVSNGPSYIKQTVTVIPGKSYRFDWFPTFATTSTSTPINDGRNMPTANPYVRLLDSSGSVLSSTEINGSWITAHAHTWQSMTGIATDTSMTVEISHGKAVDGTDCALEWSGDNIKGYRVSLYRIR